MSPEALSREGVPGEQSRGPTRQLLRQRGGGAILVVVEIGMDESRAICQFGGREVERIPIH